MKDRKRTRLDSAGLAESGRVGQGGLLGLAALGVVEMS